VFFFCSLFPTAVVIRRVASVFARNRHRIFHTQKQTRERGRFFSVSFSLSLSLSLSRGLPIRRIAAKRTRAQWGCYYFRWSHCRRWFVREFKDGNDRPEQCHVPTGASGPRFSTARRANRTARAWESFRRTGFGWPSRVLENVSRGFRCARETDDRSSDERPAAYKRNDRRKITRKRYCSCARPLGPMRHISGSSLLCVEGSD